MPERMLKFLDHEQEMPVLRPVGERLGDFDEIYRRWAGDKAAAQAARCSQCGIPFCQIHCPLQNNIPDWLKLAAEERLEEAYDLASTTNTFPEICGRICPQDRLCEGNCVIEKDFGAVTIGAVERHITELAFERPQSIAIVGAGPGGLAAADLLRRLGYQIHIYDRYDRVGGLLVSGIPNFKLEKEIVARREQLLRQAGVHFHLEFEVGRDCSLADLRAGHAAVLIATGVYRGRDIALPGAGLGGIRMAMDYLVAANRVGFAETVAEFDSGELDARDKHVVVVGGGDTAMDCVRTAVRQGARSVSCLYRRDRDNMPGSFREVAHGEAEGVAFVWLSAPEAFLGEARVAQVRARKMRLGMPDQSGRQSPEPIEDAAFTLPCDLAVKALGFDPEDVPALFAAPELAVTRWGTIRIDYDSKMTNLPGVFAAGDIVRGASLVVWAIRDGLDAARQMHAYVQGGTASEDMPLAEAS